MSSRIFEKLPNLDYEEVMFLESVSKDFDDELLQTFITVYNGRRKSNETILIATLIGLLGIAGIQRFMVNQIGMGVLFLLTGGLCYIGTIVDIVNHKKIALEYNQTMAFEAAQIAKSINRGGGNSTAS